MVDDPSPLNFLSYRSYLNAWFEHRNLRPSMAKFARDVGCSRQLVSSVCAGLRNLGEARAPRWATRMGLTDVQHTYFLELVRSEEGPTPQVRKAAFGAVQAMRTHHSKQSEQLITGLAAHWLRSVIHELGRFPDFEPTVEWIAPRLRPSTSESEIQAALDWLSNSGLFGADGQRAIHRALSGPQEVPPGARTQALAQHHFELLEIAREQLHTVPPMQRMYLNITGAISDDQLDRMRVALKEFQSKVFAIASEEPTEPVNRVYALSMQLFPLAQVPDEDDVPEPPELEDDEAE